MCYQKNFDQLYEMIFAQIVNSYDLSDSRNEESPIICLMIGQVNEM